MLVTGVVMMLTPAGAAPPQTVRGVIGLDAEGVAGLTEGGDWGAVATIGGRGAATRLSDSDVTVAAAIPDAVTGTVEVPAEESAEHACTGTWRAPTAPPDTVCIYIANADNAADIHGVSISPGPAGVRWGFKLVWSQAAVGEDTFIDATWAYNRG
jgi:hypothetical protein